MEWMVGAIVVALLLFMVAELVFGPALAVVLTGLCGLGLGGGAGFAAGIVGGLLGFVGSALVRGLFSGLSPDDARGAAQPPAPPQPPQWQAHPPAPPYATPMQSGAVPDLASWQNAPTPLAMRLPVPDERPRYGAEPRLTPCQYVEPVRLPTAARPTPLERPAIDGRKKVRAP